MRTKGGVGKVAYIRYTPQTVAIGVLLSVTLAVVFNFNEFPFPSSKPQFLADVPMNWQNAANCSPRFEYFVFFCVMEGYRGSEEIEMPREMEMEMVRETETEMERETEMSRQR
jgi:hypothetical protein